MNILKPYLQKFSLDRTKRVISPIIQRAALIILSEFMDIEAAEVRILFISPSWKVLIFTQIAQHMAQLSSRLV